MLCPGCGSGPLFLSMGFDMVGLGRVWFSLTTVIVSDAYQHPNPSVHVKHRERVQEMQYTQPAGESTAGPHDWKRQLSTRIEPFTKSRWTCWKVEFCQLWAQQIVLNTRPGRPLSLYQIQITTATCRRFVAYSSHFNLTLSPVRRIWNGINLCPYTKFRQGNLCVLRWNESIANGIGFFFKAFFYCGELYVT